MQTGDGEALADELTTILDLGDKLIAIGEAHKPTQGTRVFTFEEKLET